MTINCSFEAIHIIKQLFPLSIHWFSALSLPCIPHALAITLLCAQQQQHLCFHLEVTLPTTMIKIAYSIAVALQ